MSKVKITHIITGLNMGGAETMLYKLLKQIDRDKYEINVISMMDEGVYGPKIRDLGIQVHVLNMKRGIPRVTSFIKAVKQLKNTDIIQTWLYHADLFGYFIKKFTKSKRLIWGIRHSNLDVDKNKKSTLRIVKLNAILSKNVDFIVSNSVRAKESHYTIGFSKTNFKVIPNGFELDYFFKIKDSKSKINTLINNINHCPVITHVGRWNVLKDYPNLLEALSILKNKGIHFKAILCGTNIDKSNNELIELIKKHKLSGFVYLLGQRNDVPAIMSGSDLFVLSSSGEGFPNVVGEAMACETPCVVTDVGDTAFVVGHTGIVVPPKSPEALATGISKILDLGESERNKLGALARKRVLDKFDIHKVVSQFEELYKI